MSITQVVPVRVLDHFPDDFEVSAPIYDHSCGWKHNITFTYKDVKDKIRETNTNKDATEDDFTDAADAICGCFLSLSMAQKSGYSIEGVEIPPKVSGFCTEHFTVSMEKDPKWKGYIN
jgi:hypothetical protein